MDKYKLIGISEEKPRVEEKHGNFHRKVFFAPDVTGNKNLTVRISKLLPGSDGPVHKHAGEQMAYTLKGVLEIELDGRKYRLTPGTFSLIPPNKYHPGRVVSDEPWEAIIVSCDRCRLIKEYTSLRFETDSEVKQSK